MQTKKRAKPVKFGKAAKEVEEKKVAKVDLPAGRQEAPEEEPKTVAEPEAPQEKPVESGRPEEEPPAPAHKAAAVTSAHGGELVDKLSDVPFETDFGTPAETTPAHSTPAAAEQEPVASTPPAQPHQPEEISKPAEPAQPIEPQFDVSPVSPNAPIGRANEPIPYNPHETVFNTPPDAGEKKKNPFLYFIIIALVAFVTGIAFMAGIYYAMPEKNLFAMPSLSLPSLPGLPAAQPTPTPTPAIVPPTPTSAKTVALSDYTVKVLNGSGVRGEAAKVKASLEAEGFKVGSIGNADSNDVAKTQITVKKSVDKAAVTKLTDALKKTYVLDKVTELPATATSESDITVTIGKETAK